MLFRAVELAVRGACSVLIELSACLAATLIPRAFNHERAQTSPECSYISIIS